MTEKKEHILIVEDSPTQAVFLRRVLEAAGYRVSVATDGLEALAKAGNEPPHLIITDVVMPGMDGYEFHLELKRTPELDRIPCVLLTVLSDMGAIYKALAAGVRFFLTKPFDKEHLLGKIRTILDTGGLKSGPSRIEVDGDTQLPTQLILPDDADQLLNLLVSAYEDALLKNRRMEIVTDDLHRLNAALEGSRSDILSVVNELGLCSATIDEGGRVTFLSNAAGKLLGCTMADVAEKPWQDAFAWRNQDLAKMMLNMPRTKADRSPVRAEFEPRPNQTCWTEIEIFDDPRDPAKRIFLFRDTTELHQLRRQLEDSARKGDIIARSEGMKRVFAQIARVAKTDLTVLIEGDTGTGKELVARAIHESSNRSKMVFVPVNCAGLTDSLLSSQLFGHRKGAFTGAIADQKGVFEAAHGGTIFLDEIGDISQNVQTTLLRVLETKEVVRLGETAPRQVDVRIVVATHRDLAEEVEAGRFRQDLLYRIRIARVTLPPLRQRREDIPLLAQSFLRGSAAATGKKVQEFSPECMRAFMGHSWPGNVRELKSAVEFAVINCVGSVVQAEDLPPEIVEPTKPRALVLPPPRRAEDDSQRIVQAVHDCRGNRSQAARQLGMSRATFYRRLKELGLSGK